MDIVLDKISQTEALIKINLKEKDYQPKVEEKIKEYSKKANIKGFRPGKVPTGLIKKMYGKSILVDEVNHMLSHSVMDYIKENDIQILGEPLPNVEKAAEIDWDNATEFDFEYSIGIANEFELTLDKKLKVDSMNIKVDDQVINETLDNLKQQFGTTTNPEIAEEGDSLYGEFSIEGEEEPATGSLNFSELDKKDIKKFIGKKKDDEIIFNPLKIIKNEEHRNAFLGENANSVSGDITFKVKNVNRVVPAEVNQDLFDKTFGPDVVTSEAEFIEKIKESISSNYEMESNNYLDLKIREKLIEKAKITLPDEFLKRWIEVANKNNISKEEIERDYEHYSNDLKWTLIKNKISKQHDIKAEHEDVVNEAKALIRMQFASSGLGSQLEDSIDTFADNYLKGNEGDNYMKLHEKVFNDKILAFIKENVTIKNKEVSAEEFRKKA